MCSNLVIFNYAIGSDSIEKKDEVWNLGVVFDWVLGNFGTVSYDSFIFL